MKERLQKLMAQANLGSRRAAEEIIEAGRVRVNGKVAHLGDQADPDSDVIEVDGRRLRFDDQPKMYIAINKPRNVITTNVGHHNDERPTIRSLVPVEGHLFTIGRLDVDSEGLVVLTNDGDLAQKLSHPRFQHTKTYKVIVFGLPTAETIEKWQNGVYLEDGRTAPAFVRIMKGATDLTTLKIIMTEGKKRQIRRVASLLGHPVKRLVRTHIGMLELGSMERGQWRMLSPKEVEALSTPAPEVKFLKQQAARSRGRRDFEDAPRRTAAPSGNRPARRTLRRREETAGSERRTSRAADAPESDRRQRYGAETPTSSERPPRRTLRRAGDAAPTRDSSIRRPRRASDVPDAERGEQRPPRRRTDTRDSADRPKRTRPAPSSSGAVRPYDDDATPAPAPRPPARRTPRQDDAGESRPTRRPGTRSTGRTGDDAGGGKPAGRKPGRPAGGARKPGTAPRGTKNTDTGKSRRKREGK